MEQSFKFVNRIDETISSNSFGFGCDLECPITSPDITVEDLFEYIADANQWQLNDILAVGDYGNIVWIENNIVRRGHLNDLETEDIKFYKTLWKTQKIILKNGLIIYRQY